MRNNNKKIYESLPFRNKAIDTITITGFNPNKQHKIVVPKEKVKKDLNKKEPSKAWLESIHGWPSIPKKKK